MLQQQRADDHDHDDDVDEEERRGLVRNATSDDKAVRGVASNEWHATWMCAEAMASAVAYVVGSVLFLVGSFFTHSSSVAHELATTTVPASVWLFLAGSLLFLGAGAADFVVLVCGLRTSSLSPTAITSGCAKRPGRCAPDVEHMLVSFVFVVGGVLFVAGSVAFWPNARIPSSQAAGMYNWGCFFYIIGSVHGAVQIYRPSQGPPPPPGALPLPARLDLATKALFTIGCLLFIAGAIAVQYDATDDGAVCWIVGSMLFVVGSLVSVVGVAVNFRSATS